MTIEKTLSISQLVKNMTGEKMSEVNAMTYLQSKANQNGTCFVRVLPVEKGVIVNPNLSGNMKADEHEHWLCEIIVAPVKWNTQSKFFTFRVNNDETALQDHVSGNTIYSEFAQRDICTLETDEDRIMFSGEDIHTEVVPFCEPLIDIPFEVSDIIVVHPQTLKEHKKEVRNAEITDINVAVEIDITDILGYLDGETFEPFLHLVVEKIPIDFGSKIKMADGHKQYRQYLRYIKGAIFLPLQAGCFITTNRAVVTKKSEGYGKGNTPMHIQFKYNGRKHSYRVVREDKNILAYTVGKEWRPTPTVYMCTAATDTEVMQELYGYSPTLEGVKNSGKYFRQQGVAGFVLVTEPIKITLNIGEIVFAQQSKAIANIRLVDGKVALYMAADKVAFIIDLQSMFRVRDGDGWKDLDIPSNIREAYLAGTNPMNINNVIDYSTAEKHIMKSFSFGHAVVGFDTKDIKAYRFFYTFRNRIAMTINKEQIKPQGNILLVKVVDKPKAEEGTLVVPDSVVQSENVSEHAMVVSVGEGSAKTPMQYKVGQRVSFPKFLGIQEVFINETEKYVYLDQKYVISVISE